jgi:putative redox protein
MSDSIQAKVELVSKMKFVGVSDSGHSMVMDTSAAGGEDTAAKPMETLLMALGGCTGMDVISVLRKMRIEVDGFEIGIAGDRSAEHPKIFTRIQIKYRFRGKDLPYDKIKHAVELSQEKYCPVSAMLRPTAKIDYKIEIIEDE